MTESSGLSSCCHATMSIVGHTTHYYVCTKCSKQCDQASDNKEFSGCSTEKPKFDGEREKLASQLHDIYMKEADKQGNTRNERKYEDLPENVKEYDRVLADYIIADRKRIVEPLVEWKNAHDITTIYEGAGEAIEKALKNAGLGASDA